MPNPKWKSSWLVSFTRKAPPKCASCFDPPRWCIVPRVFHERSGTVVDEAPRIANTPHFANPGANVSNLQLNTDGSVKSLNGYDQITAVNPSSRLTDERYFRFGIRLGF
jgi:hypothetical protein